MRRKKDIYSSLAEASSSAQRLGLKTYKQYTTGYRKDPLLICTPRQRYANEWINWTEFLTGFSREKYATLLEARDATQKLGIKSHGDYGSRYRLDPRLTSAPNLLYSKDWIDWYTFLGKSRAKEKYPTINEAKAAVAALAFRSIADYRSRYRINVHLPAEPSVFYAKEWKSWSDFLGVPAKESKYDSLVQASIATRKLSIKTSKEYPQKYKQDQRLPATPERFYEEEWTSWSDFLGAPKVNLKYPTLDEARAAVQKLGINERCDYISCYRQDPRLPSAPHNYYDDWINWYDFFGTTKGKYATLAEAKAAVRLLGFRSFREFKSNFRQDARLPSVPNTHYSHEWVSWSDFLTGINTDKKYKTFDEARCAAQRIGFEGCQDYKENYQIDPLLPSNPNKYYSQWINWADFIGKQTITKYPTLAEARIATQRLGLKGISEYRRNCKADPLLAVFPDSIYKKEWVSWSDYLGIDSPPEKYASLAEARLASNKLGFVSMRQYKDECELDPRLPKNPRDFYAREWVSTTDFLLPKEYKNLSDVKRATKILRIKNSSEYRSQYKLFPPLPAHPERTFCKQWIDWYEFCDISRHLNYEEARSIVTSKNITSQIDYNKLLRSGEYPRLPKNPNTVYIDSWRNWHTFVGREEPFKAKYIREPYLEWRHMIADFLRSARAGSSKENSLCQFLRLFVEKYKLGHSPQAFLMRDYTDIRPFKDVLDNQSSDTSRRRLVIAVNEFLEYVLHTHLTEEDDETGELVTVSSARNPLASISVPIDDVAGRSESYRPALAYQYVESLRAWIIPEGAKTFSDLTHLHRFEADWIDVDPDSVDRNDLDCVWKIEGAKTKVWFPVYWIHTFALTSVPARGRQIAYNDSGEGDSWIPVYINGALSWEKNIGKLSGSTKEQGFIKRFASEQTGMHFTSNKTLNDGGGYDVPWIPLELVYWLVRLREWQEKYNPLEKPTLWSMCRRTDLNEKQLIARGANCFLFRDYGEVEPGGFSGRLSSRLAAALYYSQPSDLKLAELDGNAVSLSSFSSKYTPHSMRVSLITAYVMEFGLPIEIIMKVAGHSSIIMTLYYTKTNAEDLRFRFDEGEKIALKSKAYAAQRMIEQGRIDEIKHELVSNSDQALKSISNESPAGTFLFRDYGICPFAGSRCVDGGDLIGKTGVRQSVPAGYLGSQNCLRCRHFISGPAFVGGLLSLSNEISLHARLQFEHYSELQEKGLNVKQRIEELEDIAYDSEKSGQSFDSSEIGKLQLERRKTCSESESAAQKLDVLMCDIQASAKLIKQCKSIINNENAADADNSTYLIVQPGHEIQLVIEAPSYFRQLTEVCENAQIYESANADNAIAPRTQLLDKMALLNQINLHLFTLDKKQQLIVGNQLTKLILSRLRTWGRVDALIEGKIHLEDLAEDERITRKDIKALVKNECYLLGVAT